MTLYRPVAIRITLAALAVLALGAAIWWVPKWQVRRVSGDRFTAENEARRTLVQLLGGIALLGGFWLALRRVKASEQTAQSALDGQVTERFSRAVDHLGSNSLTKRLGGIYALERIARDSEQDYWTVIEVLVSFIREHAPAGDCHGLRYSANEPAQSPRADVQAALTVIGRRIATRDGPQIVDLSNTDLRGADLRGLDFRKARFCRACLQSANFTRADASGADFSAASVRGTVFVEAHLDEADLVTALTGGTYCQGASLVGTKVSEDNIGGLDALATEQRQAMRVARWQQFDTPSSVVVGPTSSR